MIRHSLLILFSIVVSGLILFSSCNKKIQVTPTPPKEMSVKSFYAEVDGIPFTDTVLWGVHDETSSSLQIKAYAEGGYPLITIKLPQDIAPGDYELGGTGSSHSATVLTGSGPNTLFVSDATNGLSKITITEHSQEDDYIVGTFEFYALPSWDQTLLGFLVTNGSFTVNYY